MKITLRIAMIVVGLLATAWVTIVLFAIGSGDDFENQSCC